MHVLFLPDEVHHIIEQETYDLIFLTGGFSVMKILRRFHWGIYYAKEVVFI